MTMNVMASAGKIFLSFRFWSHYRNIERFGIISPLKIFKILELSNSKWDDFDSWVDQGVADGTNQDSSDRKSTMTPYKKL